MRTVAVSAALVVLVTSVLSAQMPVENRNARQGFWIGLGAGAASAGTDPACCRASRSTAPSGYLRLGGTVSQRVLVGGETSGWVHRDNGGTSMVQAVSAVVLWYPNGTGAFYVKVGLGALHYLVSDFWRPSAPVAVADVFLPLFAEADMHATAAQGSIGLGFELRIGNGMSVNPFVNGLAGRTARLEASDRSQPSSQRIKVNLVQVGLGVTWH